MPAPTVSVVLPAFNEERCIGRAAASILSQTLSDLELIVVDDGSTDGTCDVLAAIDDPRLRVLRQRRAGIEAALNLGLSTAQGRYIARMDADDWSETDRLRVQAEFLDTHTSHGIVGSWCRIVYADQPLRPPYLLRLPTSDASIRLHLPWRNPFVHSSTMMRASVLNRTGPYAHAFMWQDYELWCRILHCSAGANLPSFLVERTHRPRSTWRVPRSTYYRENCRVQLAAARGRLVRPSLFAVSAAASAVLSGACRIAERYGLR